MELGGVCTQVRDYLNCFRNKKLTELSVQVTWITAFVHGSLAGKYVNTPMFVPVSPQRKHGQCQSQEGTQLYPLLCLCLPRDLGQVTQPLECLSFPICKIGIIILTYLAGGVSSLFISTFKFKGAIYSTVVNIGSSSMYFYFLTTDSG